MAVHKLNIEDFDEIDYQLIAIHTTLEDYRLAYFINQQLNLQLKKTNCSIPIANKTGETQFSRFLFEDFKNDVVWNLIENQQYIESTDVSLNQGLFATSRTNLTTKIYLIPEYKKVDFFLKIEDQNHSIETEKITSTIKNIAKISTHYFIDVEKIKSKNNLIF